MDSITIIVTALAAGAAAALKPTAAQAVQDAYTAVKALIQRKYKKVGVALLESDPTSVARQQVVKEDLQQTAAGKDEALLRLAQRLLDAIQRQAPEAAGAIGVNLEDIKGASLKIEDIIASGAGVNVKGADVSGDIEIKGVRAGNAGQGIQQYEPEGLPMSFFKDLMAGRDINVTFYTGSGPAAGGPAATPGEQKPSLLKETNVDRRALRDVIHQHFSLEELELLCADIEQDLANSGINLPVSLENVGGGGKGIKILNLIGYLDRRGYLSYLVNAVRRERPGAI